MTNGASSAAGYLTRRAAGRRI